MVRGTFLLLWLHRLPLAPKNLFQAERSTLHDIKMSASFSSFLILPQALDSAGKRVLPPFCSLPDPLGGTWDLAFFLEVSGISPRWWGEVDHKDSTGTLCLSLAHKSGSSLPAYFSSLSPKILRIPWGQGFNLIYLLEKVWAHCWCSPNVY